MSGIIYEVVREVEKEVVLMDPQEPAAASLPEAPSFDALADGMSLQASLPDAISHEAPRAENCTFSESSAIPQHSDTHDAPVPMMVDEPLQSSELVQVVPSASPEPRVLKTVRKTEVQVLCPQHNPVRINHHRFETSSTHCINHCIN